MPATAQNFDLWIDNDVDLEIPITESDGTAADLIGASAKWQMRPAVGAAASLSKSSADGGITVDAANGQIVVHVAAADTVGLAAGTYMHAAEITDAQGKKSLVAIGYATVKPDVIDE